ncbi:MAG: hypothetical protein DI571_15100, partial [Arsenicicoccus sp.]
MALLARLHGIPVVLVAQPGDRRDEPHTLALRCASAVIAPWPGWATASLWRTAVPREDLDLVAVGGVARARVEPGEAGRPYGLVLAGGEGFDDPETAGEIERAVPELDWVVLDGRTWVTDVRSLVAGSEVVVAHGGQNAVADIARHQRPTVLAPQHRPHAEQEHLARALDAAGLAVLADPVRVHAPSAARAGCAGSATGRPPALPMPWCAWRPGRARPPGRAGRPLGVRSGMGEGDGERDGSSGLGLRVGVVTVAHGRHDHLREQRRVLVQVAPEVHHVVVAIDDRAIGDVVDGEMDDFGQAREASGGAGSRESRGGVEVLHVPTDPLGLPLARARNLGVEAALAAGCELLVLLDVDCVLAPGAVEAYVAAAARFPDALLAGPVTYLPEGQEVP